MWAGVAGAFAFFLVGAIDRVIEDLHGLVADEGTRRVALTAMLPIGARQRGAAVAKFTGLS